MLKRLQNLRAYVRAAANPTTRLSFGETKDVHAEQLLHAALSSLTLLLLLFSVGAMIEGRVSAVGFVILGLVLAGMLGLYVPLNRGYVSSVASALVTLLVLGTTAFLASQGTMRGPGAINYVLASMIAGLVIGQRAAMVTTILISLAVFGLYYAEINGYLPPVQPTSLTHVIAFVVSALMMTRLLLLALQNIDLLLSHSRQELAERKRTEAALSESELRYRMISHLSSDYAYAFRVFEDNTYALEWVTEEPFYQITGYERSDFKNSISSYHPDELPRVEQDLKALLAGEPNHSEYRILTKAGELRWISMTRKPIWDDAAARVIRFYGAARDITAQKLAEQALRESEKRYRIISEIISDYAFAYDIHPDGTFTPAWITEDSFVRLSGYQWNEIGATYTLYHPDDVSLVQQHVAQTLRGQPTMGEYRIITKSGEVRWLRIQRRVEWDADQGRCVRFYGAAQDITTQKLTALMQQEAEAQLRAIITNLPLIFFVLDAQGKVLTAEGKGLEKLGLRPGESVGRSVLEMYAHIPSITTSFTNALQGSTESQTFSFPGITLDVYYTPVRNSEGDIHR